MNFCLPLELVTNFTILKQTKKFFLVLARIWNVAVPSLPKVSSSTKTFIPSVLYATDWCQTIESDNYTFLLNEFVHDERLISISIGICVSFLITHMLPAVILY